MSEGYEFDWYGKTDLEKARGNIEKGISHLKKTNISPIKPIYWDKGEEDQIKRACYNLLKDLKENLVFLGEARQKGMEKVDSERTRGYTNFLLRTIGVDEEGNVKKEIKESDIQDMNVTPGLLSIYNELGGAKKGALKRLKRLKGPSLEGRINGTFAESEVTGKEVEVPKENVRKLPHDAINFLQIQNQLEEEILVTHHGLLSTLQATESTIPKDYLSEDLTMCSKVISSRFEEEFEDHNRGVLITKEIVRMKKQEDSSYDF